MADLSPSTLDVVIVTWQHGDALAPCLESLAASARHGFAFGRIIVVDNASEPPPEIAGPPQLPPVTFVRNATNRGFAAACNQGAARGSAKYLLFLNPDARVGREALAGAVRRLEDGGDDRTGLLGLRLCDERGLTQRSCGRFPTARNVFRQLTGLNLLAPHRLPGMRMVEWDHSDTRLVDFVCGACLFVRRALFEELGGFDERLFVYLEDADLAQRARDRGWRARYLADHAVVHGSGWSSGRDRALRLASSWRSLIVYGWIHESRIGAAVITGTVLALAPLARFGHAMLRRSAPELWAVFPACFRLWTWLGREVASSCASRFAIGQWRPVRSHGPVSGKPADGGE
jgi:GT2 family glycosyltransferase